MRAALSGLTTRGRCLLAAGVAAALCGVVLGERDLLRVAVLLCVLPRLRLPVPHPRLRVARAQGDEVRVEAVAVAFERSHVVNDHDMQR